MHKLTIEDDEGKTVVVPLIREEITVGRQEGNSIRLTERNISRRHARFYRQTGILYVEDLGSYNGIKVNATRITEATPLKDGDLVVVGDYKLTVRADKPTQTRLYAGGAPFSNVPGSTASAPGAGAPTTATLVGNATTGAAGSASSSTSSTGAPSVTPIRPSVGNIGNVGNMGSSGTAPAPEAQLDAAPTIPVRTLAEQGLAGSDSPPARLVVVSTNLAGSEFTLDRASLVIGRTPENDIVLNHKSISRHHAKIIRDADKYIVVDLESANGVRVNGSEFERVELQSGDTLELGHVRLKFAGGNEYVDFDAGAAVGGRRRLMIVGAVGAVALTGIVLALSAGDGDKGQRPPETATTTGSPSTTASTGTEGAASTGNAALDPLLGEARSAIAREDWTGASEAVRKALQLVPTSPDAASLRETIDTEQSASERFTRIKQASDQRKFEEVLALFPTIPERSVYRPRALPLKEGAEKKLIDQSLTEAEKAAGKQQCEEALRAIERVTALEPDNSRARTVRERCDKEATKIAEKQAKQAEQDAAKERQRQEKEAKEQAKEQERLAKQEQAKQDQAAKEQERLAAKEAAAAAKAAAKEAKEKSPVAVQDVRPTRTPATAVASAGDRPDRIERNERPIVARASDNPPPPRAPRPPKATPAAAPAAVPANSEPPAPAGDPDALLQEATQAWQRGQYAAAIETSRKALKIRPSATQAYRIIAVCSCSLRDAEGATRAYEKVEDKFKTLVKSACQRNGISLP